MNNESLNEMRTYVTSTWSGNVYIGQHNSETHKGEKFNRFMWIDVPSKYYYVLSQELIKITGICENIHYSTYEDDLKTRMTVYYNTQEVTSKEVINKIITMIEILEHIQ